MKYLLLLIPILLFNCRPQEVTPTSSQSAIDYPETITKILDAHGSLDNWKQYQTLSYEMGEEYQIIDLKNRREKIEGSNFTMGYDGSQIWVKSDTSYKGNPIFYKNLMFYFYAMPFVLADPGIIYSPTPDLNYNGVDYPGMRISYKAEVGISPQDEYFVHYNAETFQMEWLGYTVTYFSGKKSEQIKWIRYDDWKMIDKVLLPSSMEWYENEENKPKAPRSRREFSNIKLDMSQAKSSVYAIIEGATVAE